MIDRSMTTARRRHSCGTTQSSTAFTSVTLAIIALFSVTCAASPDPAPAPGPTVAASASPDPAPASGPTVAAHALFSYMENTANGPGHWGSLEPDWAICRDGKEQSPIDISKMEAAQDMGPLEYTYTAGDCTVQNQGHDFVLKWKEGNGKLTVEKKDYVLQQVHWHVPSEHTINGTRLDMEMHMVHQDSSKARAVLSVFFSKRQPGDPSKLLTGLEPYFKRLARKNNMDEDVTELVDPSPWVDKTSGYYRYEGSLTTPPCSEGVIWTIMSKVKHVKEEQVKLLDAVSVVCRW
uniref:Uncharacterized protein n=1 Tax=Avena sativa TaxID=4498 RepID=A0ACD5YHD5_AVESA